jgi:excisionase family DNA binding protein
MSGPVPRWLCRLFRVVVTYLDANIRRGNCQTPFECDVEVDSEDLEKLTDDRPRVSQRREATEVSTPEVPAMLGVTERTVRRAISRGELRAIEQGVSYRISSEEVERYAAGLEQHRL